MKKCRTPFQGVNSQFVLRSRRPKRPPTNKATTSDGPRRSAGKSYTPVVSFFDSIPSTKQPNNQTTKRDNCHEKQQHVQIHSNITEPPHQDSKERTASSSARGVSGDSSVAGHTHGRQHSRRRPRFVREAILQATTTNGDDTIVFGDGSSSGGTNFTDSTPIRSRWAARNST